MGGLGIPKSNSLSEVVNVFARLLKCIFSFNKEKIREPLTSDNIKVANIVLFTASIGPTLKDM